MNKTVFFQEKNEKKGRNITGGSGNYNLLKPATIYTVIEEVNIGWDTFYKLREIPGLFNSQYFGKKEIFAKATKIPAKGRPATLYIVESRKEVVTSQVMDVQKITNSMYKVETMNSIFFVQISIQKVAAAS